MFSTRLYSLFPSLFAFPTKYASAPVFAILLRNLNFFSQYYASPWTEFDGGLDVYSYRQQGYQGVDDIYNLLRCHI